eukprot:818600_1
MAIASVGIAAASVTTLTLQVVAEEEVAVEAAVPATRSRTTAPASSARSADSPTRLAEEEVVAVDTAAEEVVDTAVAEEEAAETARATAGNPATAVSVTTVAFPTTELRARVAEEEAAATEVAEEEAVAEARASATTGRRRATAALARTAVSRTLSSVALAWRPIVGRLA